MVIWKYLPVKIKHKITHCKKIGGKIFKSFIDDYGDVPVGRYNDQTGIWEEVDNHRGKAYAARKRQKYRRKRNERI